MGDRLRKAAERDRDRDEVRGKPYDTDLWLRDVVYDRPHELFRLDAGQEISGFFRSRRLDEHCRRPREDAEACSNPTNAEQILNPFVLDGEPDSSRLTWAPRPESQEACRHTSAGSPPRHLH